MNINTAKLNAWKLYSLCGFALFSCVSTAISNIFLGLASLFFFLTLSKSLIHDIWQEHKTLLKLLGCFFLTLLISTGTSSNIAYSIKEFFVVYFYRAWPFYIALTLIEFPKPKEFQYIKYCLIASVVVVSCVVIYQNFLGTLRAKGFNNNVMYVASYYCS